MTASTEKTPNLLWAQRPTCVYITIDVQDVKDAKLDVANDADNKHATLTFAGAAGADSYALSLPLYAAVDKDKSKFNVLPRHIFLILEKSEAGSWPRLTKEPSKGDKHIKVDWDKWVDSDEEAGPDDFDMGGMGGFGGGMGDMMGGMGGMMGGMGGGMGGMDISQLMAQMGGGGGGEGGEMPGLEGGDSDDDDNAGLPSLEAVDGAEAAAAAAKGSGGDDKA